MTLPFKTFDAKMNWKWGQDGEFIGTDPVLPTVTVSPTENWRADKGITLVSGKVSDWVGEVGARSMVQTTAAKRTTILTNGFAGHDSMVFDGVDDFLTAAAGELLLINALGGNGTIYMAIRTTKDFTSATAGEILVDRELGGGAERSVFNLGNFAGAHSNDVISIATGGGRGVFVPDPFVFTGNEIHIIRFSLIGTTEVIAVDGVVQSLTEVAGGLDDSVSSGRFGRYTNFGATDLSTNFFDGEMAEHLIYPSGLTAGDITTLSDDYFLPKYGVAA